jgi:murein DD-endopeptidase MepM/ murein hydrolase activator NlpD
VRSGRSGRWPGAKSVVAALGTALALAFPGAAVAATGGAVMPGAAPPPPTTEAGAPAAAPSAGAITLLAAETAPRKSFYYGYRAARLKFTIGSTQAQNDIRVDVLDANHAVIKTFYLSAVEPNVPQTIRWDGSTNEDRPAPNGRYSFRVSPQTAGAPAARRATTASAPLSLGLSMYRFAFPVLGPHEFGMGAGRFGASRDGHTHQGQDTMAACGTPLVAARGGVVQYSGYQSLAGNYLVIDGRGSPIDFMYAHLAEPSPLQTGEAVRTGQPIGVVGETGDATACHLHFEMWSAPGWYEGGSPFDPLPYLEEWDRYS